MKQIKLDSFSYPLRSLMLETVASTCGKVPYPLKTLHFRRMYIIDRILFKIFFTKHQLKFYIQFSYHYVPHFIPENDQNRFEKNCHVDFPEIITKKPCIFSKLADPKTMLTAESLKQFSTDPMPDDSFAFVRLFCTQYEDQILFKKRKEQH